MAKRHKGKKPSHTGPTVKATVSGKTAPFGVAPLPPTHVQLAEGQAPPRNPVARVGHGGGIEPTTSSLRAPVTLQQQRAAFALARIRALADEWQAEPKKQKEFNSYASAMPFMIHANGLGQTAAFYRRKGPDHTYSYYRLYKLLGDWLGQPGQPFAGQPDLLDGITRSDLGAYLAAQAEALLFLDWVKKLASAFLARDEEIAP